MRVLALDTTTRDGSVALVEDDRVIDERRGDPGRTHAERLPGELDALVRAHGSGWAEIDLFAVASGPGSFTGLRIGIATIQGLAFVNRRRVVGIPALDALAQLGGRGEAPGAIVAAWMDAHRSDVFAALYRITGAPLFAPDRLVTIEGPTVGDPVATIARWAQHLAGAAALFVGDGAMKYGEAIARHAPQARIVAPRPLAAAIGRLAIARALGGDTVDPAGIQPLYVRRSDAEIDRDKRTFTTMDTTDTKGKP